MKYKMLAVSAIILISASATAGTIFKWEDDQGQVHYTDQRPVGHRPKVAQTAPSHAPSDEVQEQKFYAEHYARGLANKFDQDIKEHVTTRQRSVDEMSQGDRNRLEQIQRDITYQGDSHIGSSFSRSQQIRALEQERALIYDKLPRHNIIEYRGE